MKILFLYPNISMSSMVPLGIASLSAYLKQHGFETAVFDTTFYDTGRNANISKASIGQVQTFDFAERGIGKENGNIYHDFRKSVLESQPDLIAVSITEDAFYLAMDLLMSIQDLNVLNIIGGVFPTFATEKVILQDCVDMVCIGEGEEALLELCSVLKRGETPSNIQNIYYKDSNEIVKTPVRKVIKAEDVPIPDYDIFPEKLLYRPMQGKVRKTIGIETQRGCPFNCAFCNSRAQKKLYKECGYHFYRRKPVDLVMRDVRELAKKHDPEFIYWVGDTFLAMPEHEWNEFFEKYMDFRIPFWMNTRPETITRKRVRQLEEMNCMRCNIGIEHGNYDFRKNVLLRDISNTKIIEAFKAIEGSSITVVANTIIGYPGETEKMIRESINFNRKLAHYIDSITVNIFAPYHGTLLREKAINAGYLSEDVIVNVGTTEHSLLKQPHISDETLRGLLRTFPLYVKLPESYFLDIKRCEKFDDEANTIYKDLLQLYQDKYFTNKESNQWDDLH